MALNATNILVEWAKPIFVILSKRPNSSLLPSANCSARGVLFNPISMTEVSSLLFTELTELKPL